MTEPAANRIDEEAARWVARLDRGLVPDETVALDGWLAEDVRHRGAFVRAQALFASFDRARALGVASNEPARISRRGLMIGGGLAAVAASAGGLALLTREHVSAVEYATPIGQVRSVDLADGSVVTLDAASRLSVAMSAQRRNVTLLAGRALFDVAKDARRPFVVAAGTLRIRAVGTSFSVERRRDAADVLMREGVVQITSAADPALAARLVAAQRLILASGVVTRQRLDEAALDRALAWRGGMLDFADVSLADAAAAFGRYGSYRIVVAPEVGAMRITGRFSAANPRGFAEAAAASLGLRAEAGTDQTILTR